MSERRVGEAGLPRVIFIGPLKTGTTWIHDYLTEIEAVALPAGTKETFFFDRYFDKGPEFYRGFFPATAGALPVEVAPSYGGDPEALGRIGGMLGDVTIVLSVRKPVSRTLSQYWHELRYGYYSESLEAHLTADDPIVTRSTYPAILAEAVRAVGEERVQLLDFDELRREPQLFCARVCACLGLPYQAPSEALLGQASNEGRVARSGAISRLATLGVDLLKRYRLNAIPQLAKKLGFRRLLERRAREGERQVSPEVRAQIRVLLGYDYAAFLEAAQGHIPPPAPGFTPETAMP